MLLKQAQTALEVDDVGVGVDDVLQPVGLAVFVGFAGAQCFVEYLHILRQRLVLHLLDF